MQMPEVMVLQRGAEETKVPVLADALVTWKVLAEKLARHNCGE